MREICFYHASDEVIHKPDYKTGLRILRNQPERQRHANGALGLWTSLRDVAKAARYGRYLYEGQLSVHEDRVIIRTIDLFAKFCRQTGDDVEAYVEARNRMLGARMQAMLIEEADGFFHQMIIFDYHAILEWELIADKGVCNEPNQEGK